MKEQGQTVEATTPSCSIPEGPGACVSGDCSLRPSLVQDLLCADLGLLSPHGPSRPHAS